MLICLVMLHRPRQTIRRVTSYMRQQVSEHPPLGPVTLVAPTATRLDVARAYAISKLGWIRDQPIKLQAQQARATRRQFVERETYTLWGRR